MNPKFGDERDPRSDGPYAERARAGALLRHPRIEPTVITQGRAADPNLPQHGIDPAKVHGRTPLTSRHFDGGGLHRHSQGEIPQASGRPPGPAQHSRGTPQRRPEGSPRNDSRKAWEIER